MSQKSKSRGSLFDSVFMAGPKVLSPPKYEPLRNGEEISKNQEEWQVASDVTFNAHTYKRSRRFLIICIGICISFLIFSLIILGTAGVLLRVIINQIHQQHAALVPSNEPWNSENPESQRLTWPESGSQGCGHTPSEAVVRGCIFDIMTTSWQHPDCYDAELNAEIMAMHSPWTFYASSGPPGQRPTPEMLSLIPLEELGFYEGTFWATREYHVWHCTYAWRQMHRAVEKGKKLDVFLLNYEHTAHCGRLIINASDHSGMAMDSAATEATVKYPLC
ncbi:hypothetical protein B7463_g11757, partial [Scytalidium lignicola]